MSMTQITLGEMSGGGSGDYEFTSGTIYGVHNAGDYYIADAPQRGIVIVNMDVWTAFAQISEGTLINEVDFDGRYVKLKIADGKLYMTFVYTSSGTSNNPWYLFSEKS